ncbi:MAG TPA: SGNH/GDSL hydrolase family protein [Planctomycetota bacterium]|nr:SGNH/GDSL hydrolase family protein [Planctomycetota bacterium]
MKLLLIAACFLAPVQERRPFPPLPPVADDPSFGAGIQRTLTLLATSTPQQRNSVRVLFYGQSITEQDWWKQVADDLRRRFPNADLRIENKAVGGFASQLLSRIAEHDIPAFYPDLVIFHVYGGNNQYEEILRLIRTRTTAEILMQRDHVTKWPVEHPEQKDPMWWDHMMNDVFLPDLAKKYGCGLADVRGHWLAYLKANSLEPKALLKDDVHLNDHGCFVMAEIVKRYLVYKPALLTEAAKASVQTLPLGKDLKVEFEGNRVDLVGGKAPQVLIDGKPPSEFPECIAFTRTSLSQSFWGPALLRVSSAKPRVIEDWTLKVLEVDEKAEHIRFAVTGSVTGPDGEGVSAERFESTSGRVVIEPGDWWIKKVQDMTKKTIPPGFEIKWKATLLAADPSTVVQGLPPGKHVLELPGAEGVRAVRVYKPETFEAAPQKK